MPIALDPEATHEYVLERDQKRPDDERPTFVFRYMTKRQLREFEQNARILKATPMTTKEVIEICAQIMCPELDEEQVAGAVEDLGKNGTPRLKKIMDCYEKAPGAEPGNAWGALNGITYYTDHIASKNPDNRLSSAWFGDAAKKKKERALEALLELSA